MKAATQKARSTRKALAQQQRSLSTEIDTLLESIPSTDNHELRTERETIGFLYMKLQQAQAGLHLSDEQQREAAKVCSTIRI